MDPKLAWYVARSTGITAWALITLAVVWGLLLSTRILQGHPTPKWLLDLHRFLGALAVVFTGMHLAGLVADNYAHFGLTDLLVPFASDWQPGAVALGIAAFYLLLAVEISSLLMRRIPRVWWRRIHATSFVAFWATTLHAVTAGTDGSNRLLVAAYLASAAAVTFLTAYRILAGRGGARARASRPTPDVGTRRTDTARSAPTAPGA